MKILRQHIHPALKEAVSTLLLPHRQDFFFYFLGHVDFYEIDPASVQMPTACATIINMRLAICWCNEYIESLSQEEVKALILHEIFHMIHHHRDRGRGYNPPVANIAQDMIINDILDKHHTKDTHGRKMIEMNGKISKDWVKFDPNYKGVKTFEHIYEWLQQQQQQRQEGKDHEMSPGTCEFMDQAEAMNGQTVDLHEGDMEESQGDIRRNIAEHAMEKAKDQAREAGNMPGDLEEIFKMLLKAPKKDNLKLLRRVISAAKGQAKENSYRRSNRRIEGLKGNRKVGNEINVILDTSGSMMGNFDKVLAEIYRGGYTVNIIECDTQVQKVVKTTNKEELKSLTIKGLGGTELNCGIDYILDPKNKLSKFGTLILTDGYLGETLDFHDQGQWVILTTDSTDIKTVNGRKVQIIKIEK